MALGPSGEPLTSVVLSAGQGQVPAESSVVPGGNLGLELESADRALCRLEGALAALPDTRAYVEMHLRCEAARSCTLSGFPTPLTSLLPGSAPPSPSESDSRTGAATRCLQAMRSGVDRQGDGAPSLASVLEAHGILCGSSTGTADREGESQTEESGALDAAPERLRALWQEPAETAEGQEGLPPLARVAMVQARIESGRPFSKANGRMARLLVPLMLKRQRGLALGLSRFLLGHVDEYAHLTKSLLESGNWDSWLRFFLRGVAESAALSTEEIRRLAKLRQEHSDAITANLGHAVGRGLRVLNRLFHHPLATVASVQAITGTSYVAANLLVSRFVRLGILDEVTGFRRNRVFLYGPYVRLFDADSQGQPVTAKVARARSRRARAATQRPQRARSAPVEGTRKPTAPREDSETPARRVPELSDHLL